MSEHHATVRWKNPTPGPEFLKGHYSREHTWTFDGGAVVPASPSPLVVRAPWSNPANVDPEEAFVASIASCHFLTFIYLAAKQGFQVDAYEDEAVGVMTKNERRVPWVSRVTLSPRITYGGEKRPSPEEELHLHHKAHEECFISNSVKTEIVVVPAAS
ncbi:MAG TPA: OsmC family protein [Polyangiaceae bacterium]|nr:OsmC family protein [Polyangiaceae bacterium]